MRGQFQSNTRRLNGHYQTGKQREEQLVVIDAETTPLRFFTQSTPAPYVAQSGRTYPVWENDSVVIKTPGIYRLRWNLSVDYITAKGNRNFRFSAVTQYNEGQIFSTSQAPRVAGRYYLPGTLADYNTQQPSFIRGTWSTGAMGATFCTPYRSGPHSFIYNDDNTTPNLLFDFYKVGGWTDAASRRYKNPPVLIVFVVDINTAPFEVSGKVWFEKVS